MNEWQQSREQSQTTTNGIMPWRQVAQTASATTSPDNASTSPIPYLIAIAAMLIAAIILYVLFDGVYQLISSSYDEIAEEYGDVRPYSDDNAYGNDSIIWEYNEEGTIDA